MRSVSGMPSDDLAGDAVRRVPLSNETGETQNGFMGKIRDE